MAIDLSVTKVIEDPRHGSRGEQSAIRTQADMSIRLAEALKWSLTTLGVSGVLLAIGFISDFAYQERLGYRLAGTEDVAGYSLESGRFLVSVATLLLGWLSTLQGLLLSAVAAVSAVVAALLWRKYASPRLNALSDYKFRALIVLLLLGAEIVLFDMPTVGLRAVLLRPTSLPDTLAEDWLVNRLTNDLWEDEACSRIEVPQYPALRSLVEGACRFTPTVHRQRKAGRFALNVLLTASLSLLAFKLASRAPGGLSSYLMPALLVSLALGDLLMLPYSYAKTVRLTTADEVVVSWKESAEEVELGTQFSLLYQRDNEVVLFERAVGNIWVIPKDEIRILRIIDERDVLQSLIRKRLSFLE